MPVLKIAINGVFPPLFSDEERATLSAKTQFLTLGAAENAASGVDAAAIAGARRAVRETVQRESLKRLFATRPEKMVMLPFLFDDASTRAGTEFVSEVLGSPLIAGR